MLAYVQSILAQKAWSIIMLVSGAQTLSRALKTAHLRPTDHLVSTLTLLILHLLDGRTLTFPRVIHRILDPHSTSAWNTFLGHSSFSIHH